MPNAAVNSDQPPTEASSAPDDGRRRIGIIGAGMAGTLVAASIAQAASQPVVVDLIEATGRFGPGLAYGTGDEQHLLNVPAGRASIHADDAEHFVDFARTLDPEVGPEDYVPRRWFGLYLEVELARAEQRIQQLGGEIRRVPFAVTALRAGVAAGRGRVERAELSDGSTHTYDDVVLALGNLPGAALVAIPDDPRAFASPWQIGALDIDHVRPGGPFRVLVVGTALTAIDAVLSLTAGHESVQVVAASRSGGLPFAQLDGPLRTPAPAPTWAGEPIGLDDLVTRIQAHVAAAEQDGFDWRDAIDGIRKVVPQLWCSLSVEDQARFIDEFGRAWELRRHRMAPRIARRIEQLRYDGRLEVRAGGVYDIVIERRELCATLQGAAGLPKRETFDRVIDCTGAATDITRTTNELVLQLLHDGRVQADVHHRGLRTTQDGALLDGAGSVSPQLHTLGALRRGQLWETTGIAEIRDQAVALGARLAAPVSAAAT